MAENITIRALAESEKAAFTEALKDDAFAPEEKKFISDAISSWDYILAFMEGTKSLPTPDTDVSTREGKRWDYLRGSVLNIVMAENLVLGQWKNLMMSAASNPDETATKKEAPKKADAKKATGKAAAQTKDEEPCSVAQRLKEGIKGLIAKVSDDEPKKKKSDGSKKTGAADSDATEVL